MADGVMKVDQVVLAALRAHGALDLVELAAETGITVTRLRDVLAELDDAGAIEMIKGAGPAPIYRVPRTLRIAGPVASAGH